MHLRIETFLLLWTGKALSHYFPSITYKAVTAHGHGMCEYLPTEALLNDQISHNVIVGF